MGKDIKTKEKVKIQSVFKYVKRNICKSKSC